MLYTVAAVHRVEALAMMTVSDILGATEDERERISDDAAAPRCRRHDPRRLPRRDRGGPTMTDIDITNADHLLTTTRSVRRRLDFDAPRADRADPGVPRGRPAGADGRQPAGLALRRRHRARHTGGPSPTSTARRGTSTTEASATTYAFREGDPRAAAHAHASRRRRSTSPTTSSRRRCSSCRASWAASTARRTSAS